MRWRTPAAAFPNVAFAVLEEEMSKAARIGKREEMSFEEEARTWSGIYISDKLPRNGDYILAYCAPNGDPLEPRILIDNKDKSVIGENDIDKLVRDKERSIVVAALVVREESQLRQTDRHGKKGRSWAVRGELRVRSDGCRAPATKRDC